MISILIPIYNGIEFIEESVSSVLRQTYDKWELIIGVNGHPQDSAVYKIAKEYEKRSNKIRVLDLFQIRGKSHALNEMVKHCSHDYVALLDVDDIWHDQKLEVQSGGLNQYDVIGSNCVWFGDRNNVVPSIPVGDISAIDFSAVNPIINSSSIIRRGLCQWNSNREGVEDYDMWLRLRAQRKRFFNCAQVLVKHRIHASSAFNSKGNDDKVDSLLISHGYRTRGQQQISETKITVPQVNKIGMRLL
jgi:glycosyltransferase involved in cell wall biosynthesis